MDVPFAVALGSGIPTLTERAASGTEQAELEELTDRPSLRSGIEAPDPIDNMI